MSADQIIECRCPVCGGSGELRTAKTGLAYTVCDNGCSQCFARSRAGSKAMRERFAAAAPAAASAPVGAAPTGTEPPAAPAKKRQRSALEMWGFGNDGTGK